VSGGSRGAAEAQDAKDHDAVTRLLGREPLCSFTVVVRGSDGDPDVIANEPFLFDGTPMPTRFWLLDPAICQAVSRLESSRGVSRAEEEVDPESVARAHADYARERDRLIPESHDGPRPMGGVGGTRKGVKCLHAHLAWWLAGGADPVGQWVADRIDIQRQ